MAVLRRLGAELSRDHGRVLVAGPPDPHLEQPAAGVAAIGRAADSLLCLEPRADSLRVAHSLGRCQLVGFGKGKAAGLTHVYNAYGHSGGHTCKAKAAKTSSIIGAILESHLLRSPGPALITVDLNADREDIDQVVDGCGSYGLSWLG